MSWLCRQEVFMDNPHHALKQPEGATHTPFSLTDTWHLCLFLATSHEFYYLADAHARGGHYGVAVIDFGVAA